MTGQRPRSRRPVIPPPNVRVRLLVDPRDAERYRRFRRGAAWVAHVLRVGALVGVVLVVAAVVAECGL